MCVNSIERTTGLWLYARKGRMGGRFSRQLVSLLALAAVIAAQSSQATPRISNKMFRRLGAGNGIGNG